MTRHFLNFCVVKQLVAFACLPMLLLTLSAGASEPAETRPIPGLDVEAELILDSMAVIDGGSSSGSAILGKSALTLDLDTGKARLWKGGRILVQVLGTFGDVPSALAGDLQVFDNIEAGNTLGVLEAWVEQSLDSKISVLFGYHDFNREFDVIENAGELLNSSFGIGPEISQIGPSLFPETHLGARIEIRPTDDTYVKIAGYEGLSCEVSEGRYYAVESGWKRDRLGPFHSMKIAFGAWRLDRDTRSSEPVSDTTGGYLLAEVTHTTSHGMTVGLFARAGESNTRLHPIERYTGVGIRLGNTFARRPDDVVSVGIARAEVGSNHLIEGAPSMETTFELTWRAQINDWIAIQPDIQYIDSPAGEPGISHALVGGIRLMLTY